MVTMQDEQRFYVYIHFDEYFNVRYVGKGQGNRAYHTNHNRYWHFVFKDKKPIVDFVAINLTEDEAFELEKEMIKLYTEDGYKLTNLTLGGEGTVGLKFTESHRIKIGEANSRRKENGFYTDEIRKRLSDRAKGQPAWNKDLPKERQPMFGKAHSDFTKMKMSKPKANTENYKKPKSKEHAQRISEALKNANHPTKACGICGKEFQPNNGKARFCLECQKISHYQRQKLLGNK